MATLALRQCLTDQETAASYIEFIRASYTDDVWRNAAERWWLLARQKLEQRAVDGDFFEGSKIDEFENLSILANCRHIIMKRVTSCSYFGTFFDDCCIAQNEIQAMIDRLRFKNYPKLNFTHDPREIIWARGNILDLPQMHNYSFTPDFSFEY